MASVDVWENKKHFGGLISTALGVGAVGSELPSTREVTSEVFVKELGLQKPRRISNGRGSEVGSMLAEGGHSHSHRGQRGGRLLHS